MRVAAAFEGRIRTLSCSENIGLASASNIGIRAARGRYIVRVDADDFVHPEFLRFLLRFMELKSRDCDAVAVDYSEVDSQGNLIVQRDSTLYPIACGVAFKSEVMLELGLYREGMRIGEDSDFMNKFIAAGYKLEHLKLPLYRYTQHDQSLTANKRVN
jgi:glycosyltransferase involved in cell wall biosynthesis